VSDAWLQRTLQFLGLVLCIKPVQQKLIEFYAREGRTPRKLSNGCHGKRGVLVSSRVH
jgi:hypothetical protein